MNFCADLILAQKLLVGHSLLSMEKRQLQLLAQIKEGQLKNLSVYGHALISGDVGKYNDLRTRYDRGEDIDESLRALFDDLTDLYDLHRNGYIETVPVNPRSDHIGRPTDFHTLRITALGRYALDHENAISSGD
jgi:hypothetical protein